MVTQEELEKMSPEEIAQLQKQNCPFCKMISGEIPSFSIFETDMLKSVLDIYPSRKGHALVFPKEHFPLMPVIPPPLFKEMFHDTKIISKGLKKAMLVPHITLFIASGQVAGQQAAHFLFHVVPREPGDNLSNFDIEESPQALEENRSLFEPLKQNITTMMLKHQQREGKSFAKQPLHASPSQTPTSEVSAQQDSISQSENSQPVDTSKLSVEEIKQMKKDQIAKLMDENQEARELIKKDPESFKKLIDSQPQIKTLFEGVDIDALSQGLQQIDAAKEQTSSQPTPQKKIVQDQPVTSQNQSLPPSQSQPPNTQQSQSVVQEEPVQKSSQKTSHQQPTSSYQPQKKPEVFLGSDPYVQKERVFAYFKEKPKAKELLMSDTQHFKSLLEKRPDVQKIFNEVNIDKLAEKLVESQKIKQQETQQGGQQQ